MPIGGSPVEERRAIRIEDLTAWFGARRVIADVSLPIPPRQITAIIGPSGSGKSTFLRCLNRLHEFSTGQPRVTARTTDQSALFMLYEGLADICERNDMPFLRALAMEKALEQKPNETGMRFNVALAYGNSGWDDL